MNFLIRNRNDCRRRLSFYFSLRLWWKKRWKAAYFIQFSHGHKALTFKAQYASAAERTSFCSVLMHCNSRRKLAKKVNSHFKNGFFSYNVFLIFIYLFQNSQHGKYKLDYCGSYPLIDLFSLCSHPPSRLQHGTESSGLVDFLFLSFMLKRTLILFPDRYKCCLRL